MLVSPNHPYTVATPGSLPMRLLAHTRRCIYDRFLALSAITPQETLLDVGATGDNAYDAFNYIEAWYPYKDKITSLGLDDASFLQTQYPGLTFLRADGLALPFADNSFDVVFSHAVIEHVGSTENQRRLIAELLRVTRRGVFLTTPNRWFPIELHTLLPLLHWLPPALFRSLLRQTKYEFYSHEQHLHLLTKCDLRGLVPEGFAVNITSASLLGWPSNLILWIEKAAAR